MEYPSHHDYDFRTVPTRKETQNFIPLMRRDSCKESIMLYNIIQNAYGNSIQLAKSLEDVCLFGNLESADEFPCFNDYQMMNERIFNANTTSILCNFSDADKNEEYPPSWLPVLQATLDRLTRNLQCSTTTLSKGVQIGDTQILFDHINRLVPPELPVIMIPIKIDAEIINAMTNLISKRWTSAESKLCFLPSHHISTFYNINFQMGPYVGKDVQFLTEECERFLRSSSTCRKGQNCVVSEARWIFVPFEVDGDQWVSFTVDTEARDIVCFSSNVSEMSRLMILIQTVAIVLGNYMRSVESLRYVESPPYCFRGISRQYPQQNHRCDSGMFVILAAYGYATGRRANVNPASILVWRKWIAANLLQEGSQT